MPLNILRNTLTISRLKYKLKNNYKHQLKNKKQKQRKIRKRTRNNHKPKNYLHYKLSEKN